jgi:hypothetical protein
MVLFPSRGSLVSAYAGDRFFLPGPIAPEEVLGRLGSVLVGFTLRLRSVAFRPPPAVDDQQRHCGTQHGNTGLGGEGGVQRLGQDAGGLAGEPGSWVLQRHTSRPRRALSWTACVSSPLARICAPGRLGSSHTC